VLEHLIRIDESQNETRELIDTAYYALEELGQRMGEYAASVEHDPARLEKQRHRLDVLFRLKTKYGPALSDVADTLAAARAELELLDQADDTRAALIAEESAAAEELGTLAKKLSAARSKGSRKLERAVLDVLPHLGMASAQFVVALEPVAEIGANGAENVQFRIAVNAGFEPRELARVASGGELSRIMLALKTILARLDAVPTLIFDEIDAGIGGRVAVQVAQQLREVSAHHQVFVITHLAQIASRADHQLLVEKVEREGTTLTRVSNLSGDERVRELARMLGGDPESHTSIQHARELLNERG
jgi:DNA repair protein RecN (Recombination protein N)